MKNKIFFASGAVLLAAAVSLSVYVNNEKNSMTEFFNANVEALAGGEHDYDSAVWDVYYRTDGGINCTSGGNKACRRNGEI